MKTILWALATFICSPFLLLTTRKKAEKPHKILVIRFGKIGDLVATTPIIRALKERQPQADIYVLCRTSCAAVLRNNPFIHTVHTYDEKTDRRALLRRFRRERFDWVISVMPDAFASIIGIWSGAPVRSNTISSVHGILVRVLSLFSTHTLHYGFHQSTFTHQMKILQALHLEPIPYKLDIFPGTDDVATATQWMEQSTVKPKHFVVLNPTAGNGIKEWPVEKWAELAGRIHADYAMPVVLSTLDQSVIQEIRTHLSPEVVAVDASTLNLHQAAVVYGNAAAFVSVDTGPLYIAEAMQAPIAAMVGPVDPVEQMPPPSSRVIHVPPPAGTVPWVFIAKTPRTGTDEQLRASRETTVDSVWDALSRLLGKQ
ncbi:glycosyltransferase family 9 protein [Candidatus Peribacteria bacterium]|nr:MAG: glycosyltransferase family 9 protein [Candidatus Peribacteria bacterium]